MKKLILFLESIRDSSNMLEASAIQYTIDIIRTYGKRTITPSIKMVKDDAIWMNVNNSLPPLKPFFAFRSLNVNVTNEFGEVTVGYYDYYEKEWHCDNIHIIPYKWAYVSQIFPNIK